MSIDLEHWVTRKLMLRIIPFVMLLWFPAKQRAVAAKGNPTRGRRSTRSSESV
ncbi:MAG TPA: hypothetical protein VGL01_24960 [Trinickia sp.]|uniref:hypothetical protein n=1 Tax=Trinickia sp. TaxID=2571163 RepID=UPI002F3FE2CD